MSINLPNQYTLEFTAKTQLLLQIMGGKLRNTVMSGSHSGEGASPVNQYAAVEAKSPEGRFAPLTIQSFDTARRWVFPSDYDIGPHGVDARDLARMVEDPRPPLLQNHAMAIGREIDRTIIAAATATANIGKQGASTEAFDTANFQVAAGGVGMTLNKLRDVRKRFLEANVDLEMETPTLLIGPEQEQDFLGQAEVTNRDFNGNGTPLATGRIPPILGFNVIVTNLLPEVSAGVRGCLAYVKSGVHYGTWKESETRVDQRIDTSMYPYQTYSCGIHGATRLEQGRVIQILCSE